MTSAGAEGPEVPSPYFPPPYCLRLFFQEMWEMCEQYVKECDMSLTARTKVLSLPTQADGSYDGAILTYLG